MSWLCFTLPKDEKMPIDQEQLEAAVEAILAWRPQARPAELVAAAAAAALAAAAANPPPGRSGGS